MLSGWVNKNSEKNRPAPPEPTEKHLVRNARTGSVHELIEKSADSDVLSPNDVEKLPAVEQLMHHEDHANQSDLDRMSMVKESAQENES